MPDLYDVVIVGSGPGGSTAAYYLCEAGMKVLVIEKETLPRYKTCGGGISLDMLKQFPFPFDPVIETRVTSVLYTYKDETVEIPIPDRSIGMVMRDHFDSYILSKSKAEVWMNQQVQAVREGQDYIELSTIDGKSVRGRFLIGADGANSIVAHALGLRKRRIMAGAIEVEAEVSPEVHRYFATRPLFAFGELRYGYLWIFPKRDHLSVGIGGFHPKPGELRSTLAKVMGRYGIELDHAPVHGHPIPIFTHREPISTSRTLLVGDAAGLVDPFTGEGIRFAISSGRKAAEAVLKGRVDRYAGQIQREIGASHTLGLGLARLFYRLPGACYELGVRNPSASKAFSDMLSGRANYPGVIFRLFATLPFHLARESISLLRGVG